MIWTNTEKETWKLLRIMHIEAMRCPGILCVRLEEWSLQNSLFGRVWGQMHKKQHFQRATGAHLCWAHARKPRAQPGGAGKRKEKEAYEGVDGNSRRKVGNLKHAQERAVHYEQASLWQLSWGGRLMGSRVVKPGPSVAGWDSGLWLGHCLFPRPFLWRSSTLCFLATLNWAAFLCHVSLLSRFGANRYWDLWDCRPS